MGIIYKVQATFVWLVFNLMEQNMANKKQISFTLYPAHSRIGKGKLVLRHSVPHLSANFGGPVY